MAFTTAGSVSDGTGHLRDESLTSFILSQCHKYYNLIHTSFAVLFFRAKFYICEDGRGYTAKQRDRGSTVVWDIGWWKRQKINIWFGFEERHQSSLQWN
jgi:hypothetical protein